ncbi:MULTISPECIES: hypothetical protein [Streptomyces]|uniref:hypothetical protein n=1 Tax=Streptomyces TaxID=1883 RepID=UPI001F382671|nr:MULTISPECIES: hypothetical protein [Streptomyces]
MKRQLWWGLAVGTVVASVLLPIEAHAARPGDKDEGAVEAEGGAQGDEVYSRVRFNLKRNAAGPSSGPLNVSASTDWSPPPCWYEPAYTPEELKQKHEEARNQPHTSGLGEAIQQFEHRYINGNPYKDYNLAKAGEGMWWDRAALPYEEGGDIFACMDPIFWVDNGEPPEHENAVTPEVLAGLAYSKIRVPDSEVQLSPAAANQKVNLATWAWLDSSSFKPVSVTASLEELGIEATTTATPVSLKLEPGTKDATIHPPSGECTLREEGTIGTPYTRGAEDQDPPCGMTYLRASTVSGPYEMRATITWEVEWTGTGGAGGDLPDGTFGTTQDITVQEVQAINR